jgi:hypothetical protein
MRKITIVLSTIAAVTVIGLAAYLAQLGTSSSPSNTSNEVCATRTAAPEAAANPGATPTPASTTEPGTTPEGLTEEKSDQAQCGDEGGQTGKPGEAPKN